MNDLIVDSPWRSIMSMLCTTQQKHWPSLVLLRLINPHIACQNISRARMYELNRAALVWRTYMNRVSISWKLDRHPVSFRITSTVSNCSILLHISSTCLYIYIALLIFMLVNESAFLLDSNASSYSISVPQYIGHLTWVWSSLTSAVWSHSEPHTESCFYASPTSFYMLRPEVLVYGILARWLALPG